MWYFAHKERPNPEDIGQIVWIVLIQYQNILRLIKGLCFGPA